MPIYEYYCRENNTIYQFFARTLAQGATVPRCPDNPAFHMERVMSAFAVTGGSKSETEAGAGAPSDAADANDPRMEAALGAMEREFSGIDENDPRAMGRMMRRLSEITGEKIDGEMEEVVRKLEEGADPESLDESLGGADEESDSGFGGDEAAGEKLEPKDPRHRFKAKRPALRRDPKLYDYES